MTDEEVHALERVACPGAGACGGQFTANTMAIVLDFLGISPRGLTGIPATHSDARPTPRARRASSSMTLVHDDMRPSQILTRDAFENAIAAVAGYRRLDERRAAPARDRARGRDRARARRLRHDRRRARRSSPTSSRAAATSPPTCSRPAASALVARELVGAGVVHGDARGVDGRTLARGRRRRRTRRPGQDVVVSWHDAAEADRRPRDPARHARAGGLAS